LQQRPAEADGEGIDPHAAPARRKVMPHLVDEDEDPEHDREGDQGARQGWQGRAQRAEDVQDSTLHPAAAGSDFRQRPGLSRVRKQPPARPGQNIEHWQLGVPDLKSAGLQNWHPGKKAW